MIAIIDYEAGNLASVERAVKHLGGECQITQDLDFIASADRIILPGVGRAGAGMASLLRLNLDGVLRDAVDQGKPFLGICFGTQIIFAHSEEDDTQCLGLLDGRVVRFPHDHKDAKGNQLKVPHMGWNGVAWRKSHPVFQNLPEDAEFYFVHSFYPAPAKQSEVLGETEYGLSFASVMAKGSLVATQFHPEKSGAPGLQLLANFLAWDGKGA